MTLMTLPGMYRLKLHTPSVGADSIRPNVMGQGGALDGKSVNHAPLGFPRGEAVAFSGSSEPMKVTDEG